MTHYFLIKLAETVKRCNIKDVSLFDFNGENFSDETFESATFTIKKMPYAPDYDVTVKADGSVNLTQDGYSLMRITGEAAKKWQELADDVFCDRYASQIHDAKIDDEVSRRLDYQDMMRKEQKFYAV